MKKILMASQMGNPGKSVIAKAIAVECLKNNLSVAFFDIDLEHRTADTWMRQRAESDIQPVTEVILPNSAKEALQRITDDAVQIFDAPSRATRATLLLANSADLIVVPTTPSKKDIDLNLNMILQLIENGIPVERTLMVFNRVGSAHELDCALKYVQSAFDDFEVPVLNNALWERVGYRLATNDGFAITETSFETLNNNARAVVFQLLARLIK